MVLPALAAAGGMATNIAAITGHVGVLSAVGNQSLELMQKMQRTMRKSSTQLNTVVKMFSRAMTLFFRPFANALATLLRPLARGLLKFARSWNNLAKKAEESGFGMGLNPFLGFGLEDLSGFGGWLNEKMKTSLENVDTDVEGFGSWLFSQMKIGIGPINTILGGGYSSFADWLWFNLTNAIGNVATVFGNLGDWLWTTVTNWITSRFSGQSFTPTGQYVAPSGQGFMTREQILSAPTLGSQGAGSTTIVIPVAGMNIDLSGMDVSAAVDLATAEFNAWLARRGN